MIFTPWYCFSSLTDRAADKRHYPHLCCKHREFFHLWWLYAYKWCNQPVAPFANHVYICDCASPVSIEPLLEEIGVPYQTLNGPDDYTLDPTKPVHLKRWTTSLNHYHGSSRAHLDYLKCCFANGLDYLLLETDVLAAYDISADHAYTDFYTQKADTEVHTLYQGAICFIDKALIQQRFEDGSMEPYLAGSSDDKDFHEDTIFRLFHHGRTKDMDYYHAEDGVGRDPLRPYVHKTTPDKLLRFLADYPIESPYVDSYISYLREEPKAA